MLSAGGPTAGEALAFVSGTDSAAVVFPSASGMIKGAVPDEEFESLVFESKDSGAWGFGVMPKSSISKVNVSFGPIELFPLS